MVGGIGLDRLGAWAIILATQTGCWWEARPGPVPILEAAKAPETQVEEGDSQAIGIHMLIRAGSAHDPVGLEGIACGVAQARLAQAIDSDTARSERLLDSGLDWSVRVDRELVQLSAWADESAVSDLSGLLVDVLRIEGTPDVHRHIGREEITESLGKTRLLSWLYAGHPYGHDPACEVALDGRFSSQQLMDFYTDRYIRSSIQLVLELPENQTRLSEQATRAVQLLEDQVMTRPPALYRDVSPRMIPRPLEARLALAEGLGSEVWLGWATELSPIHSDWASMLVAVEILAMRLSPQRILGGPPPASAWLDHGGGTQDWLGLPLVIGWTQVPDRRVLLETILPRLQDWSTGPFTEAELERSRESVSDRLALGQAHRRAQGLLLGTLSSWAELPEGLEGVTEASVIEALGRHIQMSDLRIIVGVESEEELDWIRIEEDDDSPVDASNPPSYDWQVGDPIRIELEESRP
jgi:hypothetical protein